MNAANAGDGKATAELLSLYAQMETTAGQAVQAASILRKLAPSDQLYAAQRMVIELEKASRKTIVCCANGIYGFCLYNSFSVSASPVKNCICSILHTTSSFHMYTLKILYMTNSEVSVCSFTRETYPNIPGSGHVLICRPLQNKRLSVRRDNHLPQASFPRLPSEYCVRDSFSAV